MKADEEPISSSNHVYIYQLQSHLCVVHGGARLTPWLTFAVGIRPGKLDNFFLISHFAILHVGSSHCICTCYMLGPKHGTALAQVVPTALTITT